MRTTLPIAVLALALGIVLSTAARTELRLVDAAPVVPPQAVRQQAPYPPAEQGLGPLVLRMHFAKPLNIGADPTKAGIGPGLPAHGRWITNLSLSWMYL